MAEKSKDTGSQGAVPSESDDRLENHDERRKWKRHKTDED